MRVIPEVKINRHGRSTGKAGPGIGIELLGIGAVGQLHALRVGVIAVGAGIPGKGIALARKHIFSRLRAVRRAARKQRVDFQSGLADDVGFGRVRRSVSRNGGRIGFGQITLLLRTGAERNAKQSGEQDTYFFLHADSPF